MRLSHLISALPPPLPRSDSDPEITLVTADSRQVAPGALFVAYPGVSIDGHRFIPDAVARGAVAIVGEQPAPANLPAVYLQVGNGREAFAWLHAAWNGFPARQLILIGVTGTDGKTTTTNLIYSILKAAGILAGMISTVSAVIGDEMLDTGLHVTTPDADVVQRTLRRMVDAGLTHCVLEVTSHGLEQRRVDGCEFDVAVVTNITHEHLDLHGSLDGYRAAKARLLDLLATAHDKGVVKTAVLNYDDSSFAYLLPRCRSRVLAYSAEGAASAQLRATDVRHDPAGLHFVAAGPDFRVPIESPLVGEHNVANCLAALGAAVGGLGIPPAAARRGIAALAGLPGRMQRIDAGQNFIAIVDFAHTPHALERAIAAARTMTAGQVIVIFGSAGLRDREKRRLMGEVAARLADQIVLTAEDPRTEPLDAILDATARAVAAQGKVEGVDFWRVPDRGEAIAFACSLARPGDVVMACGKGHEQSMCFGEVEYPWDDREAMHAALRGRPLRTLPTARAGTDAPPVAVVE